MTESQLSICTWADATFGSPVSDASIAAEALTAMARLVAACVNGEPADRIGEEIADVVIVLARLGRSVGMDVVAVVSVYSIQGKNGELVWRALAANLKLANLLEAVSDDDEVAAFSGLRALTSRLCGVAASLAIDLPSAIDAKMAVNRARRWELDSNGHGRHVP